jgi:hypothetical protein
MSEKKIDILDTKWDFTGFFLEMKEKLKSGLKINSILLHYSLISFHF